MINLLPPTAKKRITYFYRLRLFGVGVVLLCVPVISLLMLLVPSYMLMLQREGDAFIRKQEAEKKNQAMGGTKTADVVEDLNYSLDIIDIFEKHPDMVPVLSEVLEIVRQGIQVNALSVEMGSGGFSFRVSGLASTRESLLAYTQELKRLSVLADVTLPVSDLTKSTNSSFTISARIADVQDVSSSTSAL